MMSDDSYREKASEWAKIFAPGGALSVRGTEMDGTFICLLLEQKHMQYRLRGGCTSTKLPLQLSPVLGSIYATDAFAGAGTRLMRTATDTTHTSPARFHGAPPQGTGGRQRSLQMFMG